MDYPKPKRAGPAECLGSFLLGELLGEGEIPFPLGRNLTSSRYLLPHPWGCAVPPRTSPGSAVQLRRGVESAGCSSHGRLESLGCALGAKTQLSAAPGGEAALPAGEGGWSRVLQVDFFLGRLSQGATEVATWVPGGCSRVGCCPGPGSGEPKSFSVAFCLRSLLDSGVLRLWCYLLTRCL